MICGLCAVPTPPVGCSCAAVRPPVYSVLRFLTIVAWLTASGALPAGADSASGLPREFDTEAVAISLAGPAEEKGVAVGERRRCQPRPALKPGERDKRGRAQGGRRRRGGDQAGARLGRKGVSWGSAQGMGFRVGGLCELKQGWMVNVNRSFVASRCANVVAGSNC